MLSIINVQLVKKQLFERKKKYNFVNGSINFKTYSDIRIIKMGTSVCLAMEEIHANSAGSHLEHICWVPGTT